MRETGILRSPPLTVDLADQRAWLDGRPLELGPKPFALLVALMQAPQRLLTKDELIDLVWEGRSVSDAVLTTAMRDLRRALGDDARKPEFIGTAHGRGYRFLKPVARGEPGEESGEPVEPAQAFAAGAEALSPPPVVETPAKRGPWLMLLIAALALIGLGAAWRLGLGGPQAAQVAHVNPASIAVLPLSDFSPEGDQAYFSDGLAEEILNVLMAVDGLNVASRTSSFAFRNEKDLPAPEIARRLGVRHILEGSVRRSGNRVRVTVQLIDAEKDRHLWSKTYERDLTVENIFAIQEEIANAICQELHPMLEKGLDVAQLRARSAAAGTQNMEAYDLYLRSRELFLARSNIPRAEAFAQQAVDADPKFARGWEQYGAALYLRNGQEARAASRRAIDTALRLDPNLSLAHAIKGLLGNFGPPYDWDGTIAQLERALQLDPKNTSALLWHGVEMHKLGYLDRAKTSLERCLAYDPAYDRCRLHLMWTLHMMGRTDEAIAEHDKLVASGSQPDDTVLLFAFLARRDEQRARGLIKAIDEEHPMPAAVEAALRNPNADQEAGRAALRKWVDTSGFNDRDVYSVAMKLGAYDVIRVENGSFFGLFLPEFPEYRRSPQFKQFVRALEIDDYWRAHGFPPQCRPVGDKDFECT